MSKPIKYALFLVAAITLVIFIFSIFFSFLGSAYILLFIVSLLSAIIITIIIIYTSPILKDMLATYRSMMRLENLSHPLLIELSLEAPGTYHHSLMVANLANRAAKTIGANSILTRIGGYYHDIGKTENPAFFIENQVEGDNPHSELNDSKKSAKIIINHVTNGVKLAQENHFSKDLIDLIEQHHGTTLVTFFYEQAKKKNPKVRMNDFRYPGPKPLTSEAAILMLADAIEAKIRLCNKITPLVIRETVDEIIDLRVKDRQLELSGLDQPKIERIRQSFIETLSTMFHQRIKYPEKKK